MTFLKTLLIILLVYFALKILWRFAASYVMRYLAKKTSERFERAFGQNPFQEPKPQNEGEVTIESGPNKRPTSKSVVGEYVDYEEID